MLVNQLEQQVKIAVEDNPFKNLYKLMEKNNLSRSMKVKSLKLK